jgi:hypothetical protein
MREYLDWQQDSGRVRVRVHRRVLAGLEREGAELMSGVALGTVSESAREVLVEDFAPLGPGGELDPSLPAVGYFVTGELTEDDRAFVARYFAGTPHVVLRFEVGADGVRLANVLVEPDGGQTQQRPAAPAGAAPRHRVHYRAGELPAREVAAEPEESEAGWRRLLWPAVAIIAGFLIGGTAYMALRNDSPQPTTETRQEAPKDTMPAPPPASVPPAAEPAAPAEAPPSNEADRSSEMSANRSEVQQGVRTTIDRWRTTLLSQDIDSHVALYAPSVGPYFTKNRMSRPEIAEEIRQMVKRYGPIRKYKITELTIAPVDANHAIANFRKEWATQGNRFTGAEKEQLRFVRQGSEWQIASEQELKVYWIHRK